MLTVMRRSYRPALIVRITLIFLLGFVAIFIAMQTHFWLVSIWIALLIILLIIELILFHERSAKALKNFLLSIKQDDLSNIYTSDEPDEYIREAYTTLQQKIIALRSSKEANHHFLSALVDHINIALISLDDQNKIHLINNATKELFSIPRIRDLKPLEKIDKHLAEAIREVHSGESQVMKIIRNGEMLNLLMRTSEFHIQNNYYKLVSFQNIKTELEEKEIESWQKLVRVLTHEIMNSAIPITNLISVINELVLDEKGKPRSVKEMSEQDSSDLKDCLMTIENRSKGLVNFVKATKSLTHIPTPAFKTVYVSDLFSRVHTLLKPKLMKNNIRFETRILPRGLQIQIDFELIEQVLINLMLNAIDAVKGCADSNISLLAFQKGDFHTCIEIEDNGHGIEESVMDQIFVPYFTTKKHGSGIGLSLARQIMGLHKGKIKVSSIAGSGTSVVLVF
jgi:two-component system nitrogen regulation sensor histidine kinase NtrY